MAPSAQPFGAHLKALRDAAGFTQEELATIAGLSVHAISALERGERKRPQTDTVRALAAALDLAPAARDVFVASARGLSADAPSEPGRRALPVPLTPLIGREADLTRLDQWVADPAVRLLTLVGPGGVGKTRLAVALAHRLAADATGRVLFVPLSAVSDPGLVGAAVAEVFGLDDATTRDLPARVQAACRETPTWLVLDNFEQVAPAASLVTALLTEVAALRILITSRTPLHVRGEREFEVAPLALDDRLTYQTPADLAGLSAVELFVSRVRDVWSDFHLTQTNSPVVAAICRRLDGLPLALELAAPWVKTLAAEGLLTQLHGAEVLAAAGPVDLPPRQRTMNATVAWSVQLLPVPEQRAFRRLGAIPGRFSIEAAAAVIAGTTVVVDAEVTAAVPLVRTLHDTSLLRGTHTPEAASPSYVLLETVRAYATRELLASGEHADAMEGLVRYCVAQGGRAAPGIQGPQQIEWLDRVRDDLESHRAVLGWLLAQGRADEAAALAWSLVLFWIMRGHSAEGLRWFEQVRHGVPSGGVAEAQCLVGAALMRFTHGDMAGAGTASTPVAENRDADPDVRAHACLCLGHVDYATGQLAAAREEFHRARSLFRDAAIAWGEGNSITGLAWVALGAGEGGEAARLLDEADAIWPACGPWFRALGWYLRGVLALQGHDARAVLRFTQDSLTGLRAFHDTFAFAYALVPLLGAAGLLGDDRWVARIAGARDVFADRTGSRAVDPLTDAVCAGAEADARARLGPESWAVAYAAGRRLSVEGILDEIDAALDGAA
ncbi:MAG: helix-turn-helix domain-containing protein [Acidobacteriota bacterium]